MAEEQKPDPTGQICWFEIPVSDTARAAKFYTEIFGWNCEMETMMSPAPGSTTVHMFNKGNLHGAFLLMDEGKHLLNVDAADPKKLAVLTTLCVSSIDETLEKIGKSGGKTHVPKTEIPGKMGYFARFIDCDGNLLGIWSQT